MPPFRKYNAVKFACSQLGTKCRFKHDSIVEARRCNNLAIAERAGLLTYKSQVRYNFIVDGNLVCYHNVDFEIVDLRTNELVVEDVKGMVLSDWKIKYKLFLTLYPKIRYIVNFGGNFGKGKIPKLKRMAQTELSL